MFLEKEALVWGPDSTTYWLWDLGKMGGTPSAGSPHLQHRDAAVSVTHGYCCLAPSWSFINSIPPTVSD